MRRSFHSEVELSISIEMSFGGSGPAIGGSGPTGVSSVPVLVSHERPDHKEREHMNMRAGAVCLAIACSLWACTAPATEPSAPAPAPAPAPAAAIFDEDAKELVPVAVIEPTEAMLKAALADDPDAMRDAAVALAA